MSIKEKEYVENIEIISALKFTEKIESDLKPPDSLQEIVNGYSYNLYNERIFKSCSS